MTKNNIESDGWMYMCLILAVALVFTLGHIYVQSKKVSCGEYLLEFIKQNNEPISIIETNGEGFWSVKSNNESTNCLESGGKLSFQIGGRG